MSHDIVTSDARLGLGPRGPLPSTCNINSTNDARLRKDMAIQFYTYYTVFAKVIFLYCTRILRFECRIHQAT